MPAEIRPPRAADVAVLVAHASKSNPSLGLFFLLAATTGARRGELLVLRWKDVDFEEGSLAFQRSLKGPDGPVLAPTKTRRSNRVALDAACLEALKHQADLTALLATEADRADRFVFSPRRMG